MMKRRDFFKLAAATSTTAVIAFAPTRNFVRTLKDREDALKLEAGNTTEVIFRLYDRDTLVHEEKRTLVVTKRGSTTYAGVGGLEAFTFSKDTTITRVTITIAGFLEHEVPIELPDNYYIVGKGNTFTLMADSTNGFLSLS